MLIKHRLVSLIKLSDTLDFIIYTTAITNPLPHVIVIQQSSIQNYPVLILH